MSWYVEYGTGVYTTPEWRGSATIEWVRRTPLDRPLYSNVPDAIYLLTGKRAQFTPWRDEPMTRLAGVDGYVVWCERKAMAPLLFTPAELEAVVRLRPVVRLDDGVVFVLAPRT